jgi:hypothetical protein
VARRVVALLALLVASERPAADIADACVGENTAGRLRRNGPVCRAPGFYGSSFTPANFHRRSSSGDLRDRNALAQFAPSSVARVSDPCMKRRRS